MELKEALPNFYLYLEVEKGYTAATIRSYQTDISLFMKFLEKEGVTETEKITPVIIRSFLLCLRNERNNCSSTLARRIHCLRTLCGFMKSQNYMTQNPMAGISTPKKQKKLPKYFEEQDLKRLLEITKKAHTHSEKRNRAIIYLLVFTGLRRSEVETLNWDDCDFATGTLKVNGKGQKQRIVPLHPELKEVLWDYLQERLPLKEDAMFISHYGTRMSVGAMVAMFNNYLKKLGLDKKGYSLHALRHSFATHLLRKGVDLSIIKVLMGHEDIGSTTIYTHLITDQLNDAVQKLPLNKEEETGGDDGEDS